MVKERREDENKTIPVPAFHQRTADAEPLRLVTKEQAIRGLGISEKTFGRRIKQNNALAIKMGGIKHYNLSSLEKKVANEEDEELDEQIKELVPVKKEVMIDELPEYKSKPALNRLYLCEMAKGYEGKLVDFIEFVKTEYPILYDEIGGKLSESTMRRWLKINKEFPNNPEKLAPEYGKNKGKRRLSEQQKKIIHSVYLNENNPSIRMVCDELNLRKCGSTYNIVMGYIKNDIENLVKDNFRMGKKAFNDKYEPYVSRDYSEMPPNYAWVSDAHDFEIFCLHPDSSKNSDSKRRICTPKVTVWQDMKSRMWMGWEISLEENTEGVMASFKHGIERFGKPTIVYTDNGKAYKNEALLGSKLEKSLQEPRVMGVFAAIGVRPMNANPYNAKAKPIERAWVEIKNHFCPRYLTYKGGSVAEKPERLKEILKSGEIPTYQQIVDDFRDFVEYRNHEFYVDRKGHRGQGMNGRTPLQVLEEELPIENREYISKEKLRLLCMYEKERVVTQDGITIFNQAYYDVDLMKHIQNKVKVRYDSQDLKQVYVYQTTGEFIGEIPLKTLTGFEDIQGYKEVQKQKKKLRENIRENITIKMNLRELEPAYRGIVSEEIKQIEIKAEQKELDEKIIEIIEEKSEHEKALERLRNIDFTKI